MKKILTMFFTCAVLVVMGSAMVFAQGWEQSEEGKWSYISNDGEKKTECWIKSGEDYFWMDQDGEMVVAQKVDDGSHVYYVDNTGKRICNNWVAADLDYAEEDLNRDSYWMYLGSSGRAVQNGWKTINGKNYHFTDYLMDYGFLDENGAMINEDSDISWKSATYFCGDDGAKRVNEWLEVDNLEAENGKNWIYFKANGQKAKNETKTINGKSYIFDDNGAMKVEFITASNSVVIASDSNISKFANEDGAIVKSGWIYTYLDENAEDKYWFYAGGNGQLYKDCVKNIDGKKFAFDAEGKMITGFVEIDENNKPVHVYSAENVKFADATGTGLGQKYMYFTESATPSEQGPAVTGKTEIAIADFPITVKFSSRGIAETSEGKFVIKDGYAYVNSVLYKVPESDYKYEVIIDEKGDFYILNPLTGKASRKGVYTDSWNDVKYELKDGVLKIYDKDANGKWVLR